PRPYVPSSVHLRLNGLPVVTHTDIHCQDVRVTHFDIPLELVQQPLCVARVSVPLLWGGVYGEHHLQLDHHHPAVPFHPGEDTYPRVDTLPLLGCQRLISGRAPSRYPFL